MIKSVLIFISTIVKLFQVNFDMLMRDYFYYHKISTVVHCTNLLMFIGGGV